MVGKASRECSTRMVNLDVHVTHDKVMLLLYEEKEEFCKQPPRVYSLPCFRKQTCLGQATVSTGVR